MSRAAVARDPRFAIRSRRIVTPDAEVDGVVVVSGGLIESVTPGPLEVLESEGRAGLRVVDIGDEALIPGLVDTHVHVNEPGRTEWEGFSTATRAARAGGITTLVDMPLNSVPATTSAEALRQKRLSAASQCVINVEFWGGVVPGNVRELEPLAAAGVRGFKCFLAPSGVDEFPHADEAVLREAMPVIARLGLPLLVHAEDPEVLRSASASLESGEPWRYATWLASRPAAAEVEAIRMMIRLCEDTGCPVHIVHLSAAEALPDLRAARERELPITVETCPHYLLFAAGEIPDRATTLKCAPPIRESGNRDQLWEALLAGDIDMIVSDHSPCPPTLKQLELGDFTRAWGGIASVELGLYAVWQEAGRRGASLADVVRWMSAAPARLAGFGAVKGRIEEGYDADLVAFATHIEWVVDPALLHQRHSVTPYVGRTVRGKARPVSISGTFGRGV